MKLTTKDLITILPFEQDLKNQLVASYDSMDQATKYDLVGILWGAYDALFELKLKERLDTALLTLKEGEHLPPDFYKELEEQVTQEITSQSAEEVDSTELQEARVALEKIVREMKAAGMDLKN